MMKMSNLQRGFTLIELLVYVSIFTIILTVAMGLLLQTRVLQNEIVQEQEIDRNARVAFLEMTQTIRSAASISSPALGASSSGVFLNSNAIHYFASSNGILQKTQSGQTSDLTSDDVAIQNLIFTSRGVGIGSSAPSTVSISFDMRSNTLVYGQTSYKQKNFQTTIQLR